MFEWHSAFLSIRQSNVKGELTPLAYIAPPEHVLWNSRKKAFCVYRNRSRENFERLMRILADYGLIKNPSNEDKPSIYQFPSSRKQKITWATRDNTDDDFQNTLMWIHKLTEDSSFIHLKCLLKNYINRIIFALLANHLSPFGLCFGLKPTLTVTLSVLMLL